MQKYSAVILSQLTYGNLIDRDYVAMEKSPLESEQKNEEKGRNGR
jgi:hypothetical protein